MKYTSEIEIDLSREKVVELFDDTEKMKNWQPTLVEYKHLEGEPRQEGATTDFLYKMQGEKTMLMQETVLQRNLPDSYKVLYETAGIKNELENEFESINENTTLWRIKNNYKFSGAFKMMGIVAKKAFKEQTMKTMRQFKEFAESQSAK